MNTLRDLVRSDRAVAAITSNECHLIAAVLDAAARSWVVRRCLPKNIRDHALSMRMLAGVLGRTKVEREPDSLQIKIYREMQRDK